LKRGGTIQAGPSLIDKIETTATGLTQKINQSLQRFDKLLSDENIQSVSLLLENMMTLTRQIKVMMDEDIPLIINQENAANIKKILTHTEKTTQALAQQSHRLPELMDTSLVLERTAVRTLKNYDHLSLSLLKISQSIQKLIDRGAFDIKQMTEHHLDALSGLLVELQLLMSQTNEVLEQLKRSPSDLFFKQESPKPGPGE